MKHGTRACAVIETWQGQTVSFFRRTIWQQLGKIVRLAERGEVYASGVKDHATALHAQFSRDAAGADDYLPIQTYLVPTQQKINPVAAALDRLKGICKSSAESYLRTLAAELELSASSPTPTILTELAARMNASSGTIAPSGKFFSWFRDEFAFTSFPQAEPPAIPDSFITTTIIA
jgi:hypothetical protein